jgi:PIN domain nuclease of toxin-antitoxin system
MAEIVLDTSALLAFVNGEPGGENVAEVIGDAVISTVNLAEAITKLVDRGASIELARDALATVDYAVADFDRAQAEATGALIAQTRGRGLSLGDRACLALAQREQLPVLTGDRIWLEVVSGIEIRLFR